MRTLSQNNFKQLRLLKQKKQRDEQNLFIAEGEKCIGELLPAFACKHIVATAQYAALEPLAQQFQATFIQATEQQLSALSLLQHPQGIIAYFERPAATAIQPANEIGRAHV